MDGVRLIAVGLDRTGASTAAAVHGSGLGLRRRVVGFDSGRCPFRRGLGLLKPVSVPVSRSGFNFSVGFRRNFGVFFVFASYREVKFRYFSPFFVFKFKNLKIFIKIRKKMIKN